jgi:hypothetical protein
MDRIPKIPNVERSTKNEEMSLQRGVFRRALQRNLALKERREPC